MPGRGLRRVFRSGRMSEYKVKFEIFDFPFDRLQRLDRETAAK